MLDNAAKRIPANAIAKNPKTTRRSAEFLSRIVRADFICFRRHLPFSADLFRVKTVRKAHFLQDAKACDQTSSRCAPVQADLAARVESRRYHPGRVPTQPPQHPRR